MASTNHEKKARKAKNDRFANNVGKAKKTARKAKKGNTSVSCTFEVAPFCMPQFEKGSGRTPFIDCTSEEFVKLFTKYYSENGESELLVEGYDKFCKHVFIPNHFGATVGEIPITKDNEKYLRSGYKARTPKELPVLTQWFNQAEIEAEVGPLPAGEFLDVILYKQEQILEENAAMKEDSNLDVNASYVIVCIKPQNEPVESPMDPVTMFRNALGKDQGGSGTPLDEEAYMRSVAHHEKYAPVL